MRASLALALVVLVLGVPWLVMLWPRKDTEKRRVKDDEDEPIWPPRIGW